METRNKGLGTIAIVLIFLILLVMALSYSIGKLTQARPNEPMTEKSPEISTAQYQPKNILETTIAQIFKGFATIPQ